MKKIYFSDQEPWHTSALRLGGVGMREVMPPGLVSRDKGMPYHLLVQFHSEAFVGEGAARERVGPGATLLWRPGQGHAFGHDRHRWSHTWIYVRGLVADRELEAAAAACGKVGTIPDDFPLPRLVTPVLDEVLEQRQPDALILECASRMLFRSLVRTLRRGHRGGIPERFQRVRTLIEDHLEEDWTLERLAKEAGLSPSQFRAEFGACFGGPPVRYLNERRLLRAQILLGDRRLSIKEIAALVGVNDPLYLSKTFAQRFGKSPRAWREAN